MVKPTDQEMIAAGKIVCYSQLLKGEAVTRGATHRSTRDTEGSQGKTRCPREEMRKAGAAGSGWAGLNHVRGLWSAELVPGTWTWSN